MLDDDEIVHSLHARVLNRDAAVVRVVENRGSHRINRTRARDDAEFKIHGSKFERHTFLALSQLAAGRTVEPVEPRYINKTIGGPTALVWRAEHNNTPEFINRVRAQILAHENATKGMRNKMNLCNIFIRAARIETFFDSHSGKCFYRVIARWVINICDEKIFID